MKTFAYVRASAPEHDRNLVCFDHRFIEAKNEKEAYRLDPDSWPYNKGYSLVNWYVFEAQPS